MVMEGSVGCVLCLGISHDWMDMLIGNLIVPPGLQNGLQEYEEVQCRGSAT